MISGIDKGAQRLQELVFDVLRLLTAETGQVTLNKKTVKIEDVAQGAIEDLNIKRVNIVGTARFKTDPHILQDIITRLLENAHKYRIKNSDISIIINSSNNKVEVVVENEGPQINEKLIGSIAKPFLIDEDIMHHSQGMGLGLSLCQAFLKTLGSNLKVKNIKSGVSAGFELMSDL